MLKGCTLTHVAESGEVEVSFEGTRIGYLLPHGEEDGFMVYPTWTDTDGYFKNLETACVELVFLWWQDNRPDSLLC